MAFVNQFAATCTPGRLSAGWNPLTPVRASLIDFVVQLLNSRSMVSGPSHHHLVPPIVHSGIQRKGCRGDKMRSPPQLPQDRWLAAPVRNTGLQNRFLTSHYRIPVPNESFPGARSGY